MSAIDPSPVDGDSVTVRMHESVAVKVNALVDQGIAPLVEALSEIDGLITLDSCQGAPPEGAEAYVSFTYGDGSDWAETGRLLERLSQSLRGCDLPFSYALRLEWYGGGNSPWAQLVLNPTGIDEMVRGIRASGLRSVSGCQLMAAHAQDLAVGQRVGAASRDVVGLPGAVPGEGG